MTDGKITKFKIEKKSRMTPEYDLDAIENEIEQRYENARTLEQAAQDEKAHARRLEKVLQGIRNNEVNEVTYVDSQDDNQRRYYGFISSRSQIDLGGKTKFRGNDARLARYLDGHR